MKLLSRIAKFSGILQRVEQDGEAAYVLLDVDRASPIVAPNGEQVKVTPVPMMVHAKPFGIANLSGRVKVTVKIEQILEKPQETFSVAKKL